MESPIDVVVVGAGPAGISVLAECDYHDLNSTLLLEKGPNHNQTVETYYPENKRVDAEYKGQAAICAGVLCFRDTTKVNFMAVVDEMIKRFHTNVLYNQNVDSIKRQDNGLFLVSTSEGPSYEAKYVVIAIGRMGKPNRPDYFSLIHATVKPRVHFDVRKIKPEEKDILVVGGGNSAIEFALSLSTKARVAVSYRKEVFSRLNPMNLKLLKEEEAAGRIELLLGSNIEGLEGSDGRVLVKFQGGETRTFDDVIYGIGGSNPTAFLQNTGMELDERGNPVLKETLESSVENLYVVGELSVPQGKGSIIVSFNSGKRAVESIMEKMGKTRKPEMVSLIDQESL